MSNMHAFTACSPHLVALHHSRGGRACQQLKRNDSPLTECPRETTCWAGDRQEIMREDVFFFYPANPHPGDWYSSKANDSGSRKCHSHHC